MDILYYLTHYPKFSETWIRNEIKQLQALDHEVIVITHKQRNNAVKNPASRSFELPQPRLDTIMSGINKDLVPDFIKSPPPVSDPLLTPYSLYFASRALKILDKIKFDVDIIHGHFAQRHQIPANLVARYIGVPHSLTIHSASLFDPKTESVRKYLYDNCDMFFAPSNYNKGYMMRDAPMEINSRVIPACFNMEEFSPSEEVVDGQIVTVARHVEKKGIKYGIQALSKILDEHDFEYRICSDGPRTQSLKRLVDKLGLEDSVSFLGRIPSEDLIRELDEAQLFLHPSIIAADGDRDITPVTIKEAMAMKTPPVATEVSGIPELVTEETGYVVPPKDVDELAAALSDALSSDQSQMGERAREAVKPHSTPEVVPTLANSMQKLCR